MRADQLPASATIWHPYGDNPGILTGVMVSGPDDDGMVALHADELPEPLALAADWPVDLAAASHSRERMST